MQQSKSFYLSGYSLSDSKIIQDNQTAILQSTIEIKEHWRNVFQGYRHVYVDTQSEYSVKITL